MVIPSPVGDVKVVSPTSTFLLNTLTPIYSVFFFFLIAGSEQGINQSTERKKRSESFLFCAVNKILVSPECKDACRKLTKSTEK